MPDMDPAEGSSYTFMSKLEATITELVHRQRKEYEERLLLLQETVMQSAVGVRLTHAMEKTAYLENEVHELRAQLKIEMKRTKQLEEDMVLFNVKCNEVMYGQIEEHRKHRASGEFKNSPNAFSPKDHSPEAYSSRHHQRDSAAIQVKVDAENTETPTRPSLSDEHQGSLQLRSSTKSHEPKELHHLRMVVYSLQNTFSQMKTQIEGKAEKKDIRLLVGDGDMILLPGEIDERLSSLEEQAKKGRVAHGRLETQLRRVQQQNNNHEEAIQRLHSMMEDAVKGLKAAAEAAAEATRAKMYAAEQQQQSQLARCHSEVQKQLAITMAKVDTRMNNMEVVQAAGSSAGSRRHTPAPAAPEGNTLASVSRKVKLMRLGVDAFMDAQNLIKNKKKHDSDPLPELSLTQGHALRRGSRGETGCKSKSMKVICANKAEQEFPANGGGCASVEEVTRVVGMVTDERFDNIESLLKELTMEVQLVAHACIVLSTGEDKVAGMRNVGRGSQVALCRAAASCLAPNFNPPKDPVDSPMMEDERPFCDQTVEACPASTTESPQAPLLPWLETASHSEVADESSPILLSATPAKLQVKCESAGKQIRRYSLESQHAKQRKPAVIQEVMSVPERYGRFNAPMGSTAELEHMLLDRGVKQKADVEDLKFVLEQLRQRVCAAEKISNSLSTVMSVDELAQMKSDVRDLRCLVRDEIAGNPKTPLPLRMAHNRKSSGGDLGSEGTSRARSLSPGLDDNTLSSMSTRTQSFITRRKNTPCALSQSSSSSRQLQGGSTERTSVGAVSTLKASQQLSASFNSGHNKSSTTASSSMIHQLTQSLGSAERLPRRSAPGEIGTNLPGTSRPTGNTSFSKLRPNAASSASALPDLLPMGSRS